MNSCMPVSVERVDKDKDADENVDADQIKTVRPVKWTIHRFFTRREEIDIDFSVWIATYSCEKIRKLQCSRFPEKIESHPHRRVLQADLQKNNVHNPFSDESKEIIRDM